MRKYRRLDQRTRPYYIRQQAISTPLPQMQAPPLGQPKAPRVEGLNTLDGGVIIPFVQSAVSGIMGGGVGYFAARVSPLVDDWGWGGLAACVVCIGVWGWRMVRWNELMEAREGLRVAITPENKEPDKNTGSLLPDSIRIEMQGKNGATYAWIPYRDRAHVLAMGLTGGNESLAGDRWAGRGKTYTRAEFVQVRDELLKRKMIAPVGKSFELNDLGRAVMKYLADEYKRQNNKGV